MLWQVGTLHRSPRPPCWGDVPSRGGIPNSAPQAGEVFPFPSPCPLAWEASPIPPPLPGRHPRPHPPWWRLKSQLCGTRIMMLLPPVLCSGCNCGRPAADPWIPLHTPLELSPSVRVCVGRCGRATGPTTYPGRRLRGPPSTHRMSCATALYLANREQTQHPLCRGFGRALVSEGPCGRAWATPACGEPGGRHDLDLSLSRPRPPSPTRPPMPSRTSSALSPRRALPASPAVPSFLSCSLSPSLSFSLSLSLSLSPGAAAEALGEPIDFLRPRPRRQSCQRDNGRADHLCDKPRHRARQLGYICGTSGVYLGYNRDASSLAT